MNDEVLQEVRPLIARHEGLRLTPYHCTGGKLTIGYGRNLDDVGISRSEAEILREHDIQARRPLVAGHQGLQLKPWPWGQGRVTIGYGRDLYGVGISEAEAGILLDNDIQGVYRQLQGRPWFDEQNPIRQQVLIDMGFNLGLPRLLHFKKMLTALLNQDHIEAARQMLDSRWAVQVGGRAERLAAMMRQGHL